MREGLSRLALALVLIAFCLPLFIGLGSTDLDNDEAIYSYAVESILTTGDWLGPRASPSADAVFLEKPHLKLWLVAAPIRLGLLPYNEFGLRFWDAVFGAAAFVYVFLIGRRLAGPLCGLTAALVLFAHDKLVFDHGFRSNNMDAAVVLAYCGGVYHYLRWAAADSACPPKRVARRWAGSRMAHIAAVACWFYIGFMSKFVAALFLPFVIGVCALLVPAQRTRLVEDWRKWLVAAVVVIAAIAPWFAYQHWRHGQAFWQVLFGEHVFTRFTTFADPAHVRPWDFYFTEGYRQFVRSGSAWWVGIGLVALLVAAIRRRLDAGWVVLAWAVLPVSLISVGSSKLYHYLYPFLPPFALAAGYAMAWLARGIARAVPSLPAGTPRAVPGWVRTGALVLMMAAIVLTIATAVTGTLRLDAGGDPFFRNSSLVRPLILAILCAGVALGPRVAAAAALVLVLSLVLPTPLKAYTDNLRMLATERRPLGLLAECIRDIDRERAQNGLPSGTYSPVTDEGFLHQYFYYLRGPGWLSNELDEQLLRTSLFVPGQERPVVIEKTVYSTFLERAGAPASLPDAVDRPNIVVLLPGPYGACRETQSPVRRPPIS